MLKKIIHTIQNDSLIQKNDNIIIGVSGGADSMCLLHILYSLKEDYNLGLKVVHIHHGIRGNDADEDSIFVEKTCIKMNIEFILYKYNIKEEAKKQKITEEEMGRLIRYQVFEKERKKFENSKIAVAHHMNDQAETVLLNLMRGTGLKGLGGIRTRRDYIIRPLLYCSRSEIEDYCRRNSVEFRTDLTNNEEIYTRNKIRLNLIPYIKENFNKKFVQNISNTAYILQQEEEYLNNETNKMYKECVTIVDEDYLLQINLFTTYHKIIQLRIIRKIINHLMNTIKDIHYVHIEQIREMSLKETNKSINLPKGVIVKREYEYLKFTKKQLIKKYKSIHCEIENYPYEVSIKDFKKKITFKIFEKKNKIIIHKNPYTKWFDYDKIKNKLCVRNRKIGDYIQLNNVKGKKKLKKFFIDEKIPSDKRDMIPLIADGQNIVWIIGYRMNEEYKVKENTKYIMEIKVTDI